MVRVDLHLGTGEPISGEILLVGHGAPVVMPLAQQRSFGRVVQHKRSPRTLSRKSAEYAHRRVGKRAVSSLADVDHPNVHPDNLAEDGTAGTNVRSSCPAPIRWRR